MGGALNPSQSPTPPLDPPRQVMETRSTRPLSQEVPTIDPQVGHSQPWPTPAAPPGCAETPGRRNRTPACLHAPRAKATSEHQPDSSQLHAERLLHPRAPRGRPRYPQGHPRGIPCTPRGAFPATAKPSNRPTSDPLDPPLSKAGRPALLDRSWRPGRPALFPGRAWVPCHSYRKSQQKTTCRQSKKTMGGHQPSALG